MKLDVVIGSGGVLSHAPVRMQAALMMLEGFGLEGVTQLSVDSIFMMPHLGVLASVHPVAAQEIFENDCLVHLGCAVVPVYSSKVPQSSVLAEVFLDSRRVGEVRANEVVRILTPSRGKATIRVVPLKRSVNVGAGVGEVVERRVELGECGILCDGRNRPIVMSADTARAQNQVYRNLELIS